MSSLFRPKKRCGKCDACRSVNCELVATTGPRLVTELYKAFHFDGFGLETFRAVCYDAADAGFFNVHRDDVVGSQKNRRYAVTVNLNTEDYEGGDLRFPRRYGRTGKIRGRGHARPRARSCRGAPPEANGRCNQLVHQADAAIQRTR